MSRPLIWIRLQADESGGQFDFPIDFRFRLEPVLHRITALKAAFLGMQVGAQGNKVMPFNGVYRSTARPDWTRLTATVHTTSSTAAASEPPA